MFTLLNSRPYDGYNCSFALTYSDNGGSRQQPRFLNNFDYYAYLQQNPFSVLMNSVDIFASNELSPDYDGMSHHNAHPEVMKSSLSIDLHRTSDNQNNRSPQLTIDRSKPRDGSNG